VRDLAVRIALKIAWRLDVAWSFFARPRAEGVYVALWHQGRLLAVRNSYRRDLTLPSGRRARGEDPRGAAIRELREEVGIILAPEALEPAGEFTMPHGYKRDHVHFFSLEVDAPPPLRIDRREVIWAGFMTPEEMRAGGLSPVVARYLDQLG
jgi:8-oxo-dGTP pyrophosphatase MutT (NUDIX family)